MLTTTDRPPRLTRAVRNGDGTTIRTLLTPERQEIICQTLRAGRGLGSAAAFANVARETIVKWRTRGARALLDLDEGKDLSPADLLFAEFERAMSLAMADFEDIHVGNIDRIALEEDVWTASRWLLEKSSPDWAPVKQNAVNEKSSGPTIINFTLHFDSARDRAEQPIEVPMIAQDGTILLPGGHVEDDDPPDS
jgi:hypothetical protein